MGLLDSDNPVFVFGGRGSGKTQKLIEFSALTKTPIAVASAQQRIIVRQQARRTGYEIPDPVLFEEASRYISPKRCGLPPLKVSIDELTMCLSRLGYNGIAVTIPAEYITFEQIKEANPSLWEVLRMWWQARKERKQ